MNTIVPKMRDFALAVNTLITATERIIGRKLELIDCGEEEGDGSGDYLSEATAKILNNSLKVEALAPAAPPRKVIQIVSSIDGGRYFILALCDDGTLWQLSGLYEGKANVGAVCDTTACMKLSASMQSVLQYMAKKPGGIWFPGATSNRGAYEYYADWGQGRSPQALHALVRRGLVEDGSKSRNGVWGSFRLTQEGWDLIKKLK